MPQQVSGLKSKILKGEGRSGDFVLRSQAMAEDEGFRNVSQQWLDTTIPIEEEIERVAEIESRMQRVTVEHNSASPRLVDDKTVIEYEGRNYQLSFGAVGQLSAKLGIGKAYGQKLRSNGTLGDEQLLNENFEHTWHEVDGLNYLFKEETIVGVTPLNHYQLPNTVLLEIIEKIVPGSRISHRKGDELTFLSNILIPDSIRAESDSDYGAMLSIQNSFAGMITAQVTPSVFRAICRNGCIWGQTKGIAWKLSQRGFPSRHEIHAGLRESIQDQILLAQKAIDDLLATRELTTDVSAKPMVAQIVKQQHLSKSDSTTVLDAWLYEKQQTGNDERSLFSMVNAITRAGQSLDDRKWVKFDRLGGRLAQMSSAEWEANVAAARQLTSEEVDNRFVAVL